MYAGGSNMNKYNKQTASSSNKWARLECSNRFSEWNAYYLFVDILLLWNLCYLFAIYATEEMYTATYTACRSLSSSAGGSQAWSLTFHSFICWSQERRLYFLNLLGVRGWTPGFLKCLELEVKKTGIFPFTHSALLESLKVQYNNSAHTHYSLWHFFNVSIIGKSVLPIINLLLSPHEDSLISLNVPGDRGVSGILWVWTASVHHILLYKHNDTIVKVTAVNNKPSRWRFPLSLTKLCQYPSSVTKPI